MDGTVTPQVSASVTSDDLDLWPISTQFFYLMTPYQDTVWRYTWSSLRQRRCTPVHRAGADAECSHVTSSWRRSRRMTCCRLTTVPTQSSRRPLQRVQTNTQWMRPALTCC